jgi:anthranilate phosphoribosyltransferase
MAEKMVAVLEASGTTHALVFYGHDGLDELTTTTTSTVLELRDVIVRAYVVDPGALRLSPASKTELVGGDASVNASLTHRVLDGEAGPHRDIVVLNAAAGLVAAGLCDDLVDGIAAASAAIDDGRAGAALEKLVATSKAAA